MTARLTTDEYRAIQRLAWKQGLVMLRPEDVTEDFARQAVVNDMHRMCGTKPTRHKPV